jgi:hypothetical protein
VAPPPRVEGDSCPGPGVHTSAEHDQLARLVEAISTECMHGGVSVVVVAVAVAVAIAGDVGGWSVRRGVRSS